MAHTPGPWKLHKYPAHVEAVNGLACCNHLAVIANTNGHSCSAPDLQDEQQANARLIAAAPELLAAAQAAEQYLQWHTEACSDVEPCAETLAYENIIAAIAKATRGVEVSHND